MVHTISSNLVKCLDNYQYLFIIVTVRNNLQLFVLLMVVASKTFATSWLLFTGHFTDSFLLILPYLLVG
jgi:hypothetical protein